MMSANKEPLYWEQNENWYSYDSKTQQYSINADAPDRAEESFEMWVKGWPKHSKPTLTAV